jgi:hypothetical protein
MAARLMLAIILAAACRIASAIDIVQIGKPAASIVVPQNALPVDQYAARELQYHVEISTGATLPIVVEDQLIPPGSHVYLGNCKVTAAAGIDASSLPGNSYIVKTVGRDLFIAGKDGRGNPLDLDTHEGTLFGVYDLLEEQMKVRWLWPGKLGEVIPHQTNLAFAPADATVRPLLWFKQWRSGKSEGERIWLKRQRFGRSVQPSYGHSFGNYWPRFGETHPEFFNMLPDGTRRLDPNTDNDPQYVHMCVSEPALWNQMISDWKSRGSPVFLNVCENDGWAGCACDRCLSWDAPDPDNPVPFDQRRQAMLDVFEGRKGNRGLWMLQMGSLSDRYARFWRTIAEEAAKSRPDVKVVSYVYDNYRKPPLREKLNANVLCGIVPQAVFPYGKIESEIFRKDWSGWAATGCELFLRPNFTLQAPNFPVFYARTMGEDLKFARAHGMKGTDFDSLTGQYSTQGPTLYMLAKILNHPDASVDSVVNEFCGAFGPASASIKEYFALWESIYPDYPTPDFTKVSRAKSKYGGGTYGPFYVVAPDIFTPAVMARASAILDKARNQATGDVTASARIEWLAKGLKQAELLLAAERAYERFVDSGDKTEFTAARQALNDFREQNAEYDRINFAGLSGKEPTWDRPRPSPQTHSAG